MYFILEKAVNSLKHCCNIKSYMKMNSVVKKGGVLGMTLNHIRWWGSSPETLVSVLQLLLLAGPF